MRQKLGISGPLAARYPRSAPAGADPVVEADEAEVAVPLGSVVVPDVEHAGLDLRLLADVPEHVIVVAGVPVVVAEDVEGADEALLGLAAVDLDLVDEVALDAQRARAEADLQVVAVPAAPARPLGLDLQAADRGRHVGITRRVEADLPLAQVLRGP